MSRLKNSVAVVGTLATILAAPMATAQDNQGDASNRTDDTPQSEAASESPNQTKDSGQATNSGKSQSGPTDNQSKGANMSALEDGEWISLTGTVKSVAGDEFTLNYGEDKIVVEMDDYDFYDENLLLPDDKVTVSGRMDEDFFDVKSIEASSVYVPKLGEYFYASAADEEEGGYVYSLYGLPSGPVMDNEWVSLVGTVISIEGDEMIVDVGLREFAVDGSGTTLDTSELVDVGDRVSVTGEMDDVDLFDRREIEASSVVVLNNAL